MEEELYSQVITQLDLEIKNQFGSILSFCKNNELEYFNYENLTRLLGQKGNQKMSLETFLKIMHALGYIEKDVAHTSQAYSNITLPDYLSIDNNAVFRMILKVIQF